MLEGNYSKLTPHYASVLDFVKLSTYNVSLPDCASACMSLALHWHMAILSAVSKSRSCQCISSATATLVMLLDVYYNVVLY
jgi:hypothetical protein